MRTMWLKTFISPFFILLLNVIILDTHMQDADKVPIIQIDCNVLDTKLLRIQGSSLPKHLLTELKGWITTALLHKRIFSKHLQAF